MDKTVEILNKALLDIINSAQDAKNFLVEQIPDVLHQLLVFHLWRNVFILIVWLALAGAYVRYAPRVYRWCHADWGDYEMNAQSLVAVVAGIGSVFFWPLCLVGVFNHAENILMITLAPKLYLLEYAKTLITAK